MTASKGRADAVVKYKIFFQSISFIYELAGRMLDNF